jgi:hypothetical protein
VNKSSLIVAAITATVAATMARADYPIVDKIAERVIQKYQTSSCQQLAAEKAAKQGQPKPAMEQRVIQTLHQDAAARTEFFNKVSAPIVSKLFECGMIP